MLGIEKTHSSSNTLLKDWTKVERAKAIGSIFAFIILTSCIVLGSTGNFGMVASHPEAFLGSLAGLTMLGLIFIVLGKSQKPILDPQPQHQQQPQSESVSPTVAQPISSTPLLPTGIVNSSSSVSPVVPVATEVPTVAVTMRCKGTLLKFRNNNEVFNIAKLNPKMTVAELTQRVLRDVCFQIKKAEDATLCNFFVAWWVLGYREKAKDIVIQDSEGNDLDANVILENIPNLTSLYVRFRTWVYFRPVDEERFGIFYDPCFQFVETTKSWTLNENGNDQKMLLEALTDPTFTDNELVSDIRYHIKSKKMDSQVSAFDINIDNLKRSFLTLS